MMSLSYYKERAVLRVQYSACWALVLMMSFSIASSRFNLRLDAVRSEERGGHKGPMPVKNKVPLLVLALTS